MSKYFDSQKEVFKSIPNAPYYVLSNDSFMSGWGYARDKINTCVVPCQTHNQARRVMRYISLREDQKRIRIINKKPKK